MEFISNYGLFALKTMTLVIAFLFILSSIASTNRKSKSKIELTNLNEYWQDVHSTLNQEMKNKKAIKQLKSQKKLATKQKTSQPRLFVIDFSGDIKASQTDALRHEISAILMTAQKNDEIVVRLESPGGSVNGYGLAAAQLQRIRNQGIHLTVCIDKVAASGGYLMACVANQIIAAPFAIIGSIGVVAQMPNFHRWLKKQNIDVELLTAGEFKRTLTLFAENTEKGREKFKEELELIHHSFKNYVFKHRPQLTIEKVSTGEHWLAQDAFSEKLVDHLKTSDDYLLEQMKSKQVYKVCQPIKQSLAQKVLKPATHLLSPFA